MITSAAGTSTSFDKDYFFRTHANVGFTIPGLELVIHIVRNSSSWWLERQLTQKRTPPKFTVQKWTTWSLSFESVVPFQEGKTNRVRGRFGVPERMLRQHGDQLLDIGFVSTTGVDLRSVRPLERFQKTCSRSAAFTPLQRRLAHPR